MGFKQQLAKRLAGAVESQDSELQKLYHDVLHYVVEGSPAPPPHPVKMATIGLYQKLSGYKVFVETGTLVGETVEAASKLFKECHSIELSEKHHNIARDRLKGKENVKLHLGSSDEILPKLLHKISQPAVVWLDAHHSGDDTAGEGMDPLKAELEALLKYTRKKHIILVDDARGLGVTKEDLSKIIQSFGSAYHASVLNDSVRIVPKNIPLYGARI
jgi:hypothetical protein